ncbi:MAG TPA: dockerin type I repeat-containing protein [Phycisphaerae bacterium]|nr:dockerin type I repeat-containing protein [Phycisphaerae bacterium]
MRSPDRKTLSFLLALTAAAWTGAALADGRVVFVGPSQGPLPIGPNERVTVAKTVIINNEPITIITIEVMPPKPKFVICLKIPTGAPPPFDTICAYFPFPPDHDDNGVHVSHEVWVNNPPGGPDNYIVVSRSCNAAGVCEGCKMNFPPGSILIPDPPQPAGLTVMADRFPADPATEAAVLASIGRPDNPWPEVWILPTGDLYLFLNGQPPAAPVHVSSATRPGDMNCDGAIDVNDVSAFSQALLDPAAYTAANPDCGYFFADMNGDGAVNGKDLAPFIAALNVH